MTSTRPPHVTHTDLDAYLRRDQPPRQRGRTRDHLDACPVCWHRWNRRRWDAAAEHPLLADLAAFLGDSYLHYLDSSRALAAEWDTADPRTPDQVAAFFRASTSYLYNLTIWQASGNRPDYLHAALPHLREHNIRSVLDIGSGIGVDALALRRLGYDVTTCDHESPSTRFCDFRTSRPLPRIDPEALGEQDGADLLWIIDTLDHLPDPAAALGALLTRARMVVTEDLTDDRAHGRQRFHHRRPLTWITDLFGTYDLAPQHHPPTVIWTRHVPGDR